MTGEGSAGGILLTADTGGTSRAVGRRSNPLLPRPSLLAPVSFPWWRDSLHSPCGLDSEGLEVIASRKAGFRQWSV